MRFILYGAGGIGGGIGGRLFQAGHDVVLICRGAHLAAVRERGLRLRAPDCDEYLPVPAAGHPSEITFTPDDVVILTVKTQDSERALADLETSGGGGVPVVCCQNGVENERMASRRFERVYGMLVTMPASHLTPGEVIVEGAPVTGVLHVGRYPGGVDDTARAIAGAFSGARMLSEPDPAVMRLKYAKLLNNLGNAVDVLVESRSGDEARAFQRRVREEAIAVYQAAGIDFAPDDEFRERSSRHVRIGEIPGWQRSHSSTWQSLARGHTTVEVDYLNGEIVMLGALHGVPTPYNAALRRLATALAASGEQPGRYTYAELEAAVQAERDRLQITA